MEGKGRSRRRGVRTEAKRRISAFLSVVLTTAMTLNTPMGALGFGVTEAFASASDARPASASNADVKAPEDMEEGWMTAKNAEYQPGARQDVDIYVIAEDNDIAPGNVSTMRLYLKNNTGDVVTDGVLSFTGSRIKKEDGTFTDISGSGVVTAGGELDDWGGTGAMDGDGSALDEERLDELEALEAEAYAREFGKDEDGQGLDKLTGLCLEPGQLHEIEFTFYTDDDAKDGKAYVNFKFQGEGSEGKIRSAEKFYYSIGLPSVNIGLADGQALETGVEHELTIWMSAPSWGDYEIEETEAPVKKTGAATQAEKTEAKAEEKEESESQEIQDSIEDGAAEAPAREEKDTEGAGTETDTEAETEAEADTEAGTEAPETEGAAVQEEVLEEEKDDLTISSSPLEPETAYAPLARVADTAVLAAEPAEAKEKEAPEETTTEEETIVEAEEPETAAQEETTAETKELEAPVPGEPAEGAALPTEQETAAPAETSAPAEQETTAASASLESSAGSVEADAVLESSTDALQAETPAAAESTQEEEERKAREEAAAKEAEQAAQIQAAMAIKESKVSYTVEVFGTEFKRFRPKKTTETEDIGWISCLYELAEDARPGVYYGKVTAKGKWNKRSFTTSQGFLFEITGEGTITLKGKLDGTVVEVSGPASSFPEADKLELLVEALSQEEEEAVQEAIGRRTAPYTAFSLSLSANGETADTKGPVTVKVGNKTIKDSTAQLTAAREAQAAAAAAENEEAAEPQAQTEPAAGENDTETAQEAAPVDVRRGPGAEGKAFSKASLTADGTLAATEKEKAAKETQEPAIADSEAAGLTLMKVDTLSVQAEELKSSVTESGALQMATSEVMAIYAVTGVEEALEVTHPAFSEAKTLEDGVTVTVTAEAGILPKGTELSVVEVTDLIKDALTEKLEKEEGTKASQVIVYDINLMLDGKKLSNDHWKDDHVTVNFSGEKINEISKTASTIKIMTLETPTVEVEAALGDTEELSVFEDIKAEDIGWEDSEVTTIDVKGKGDVSELEYQAEHFTPIALASEDQGYGDYDPDAFDVIIRPGETTQILGSVLGREEDWDFFTKNHEWIFEDVPASVYPTAGTLEKVSEEFVGSEQYGETVYSSLLTVKGVSEGAIQVRGHLSTGADLGIYRILVTSKRLQPQTAYFYIALPGHDPAALEDEDWRYVGTGRIEVDDLTNQYGGRLQGGQGQYCLDDPAGKVVEYPDEDNIKRVAAELYREEYKIDASKIKDIRFTPYKITYPMGWVNEYLVSQGNTFCYHVDMIVSLATDEDVTVNYWLQDVGADGFEPVESYIVKNDGTGTTSPQRDYQKEGYRFVGWYDNEDLEGEPVQFAYTVPAGTTEGLNFYAKYEPITSEDPLTLQIRKTLEDADPNAKTPEEKAALLDSIQFTLTQVIRKDGQETRKAIDLSGRSKIQDDERILSIPVERADLADGNEVYYILEEVPAEGYQDLKQPIKIKAEIEGTGDALMLTIVEGDAGDVSIDDKRNEIHVMNHPNETPQPGAVLPDTGGPGLLQMNRFGWLLLLIALAMAGTEVRYFGERRRRVEVEEQEERYHRM